MSDILIRGMEMPKTKLAGMVAVYNAYIVVKLNGDVKIVVDNEDKTDSTDYTLIEVPPHGDLIERDKLREKEFIHDGDAYAVVMSRDIRNAPTIIQASEEVYDKYTDTVGNLHWTGTQSGEHIIQLKEGE